jgi:hypothetical protein
MLPGPRPKSRALPARRRREPRGWKSPALSYRVSGKYFILHRTRGNRSITHEFFFDGESIGQVADDAASALTGEPPRAGERKPGRHERADGHTRQRDRTVRVRDTAIVCGTASCRNGRTAPRGAGSGLPGHNDQGCRTPPTGYRCDVVPAHRPPRRHLPTIWRGVSRPKTPPASGVPHFGLNR